MNIEHIASRLSAKDAAKFRTAALYWKLACDRVGEIREQELRDVVASFKNTTTTHDRFGMSLTAHLALMEHLRQFGFIASMAQTGVYNVWDDATCQSFQLTGV